MADIDHAADGLIHATVLDGAGGGRDVGWNDIVKWTAEDGPLWVHLDRAGERSREWLRDGSGLPDLIVEALLEDETRPRSQAYAGGLLVILRGVNLNPGADPEDMVSIRIWIERDRMISVRLRRLMAVRDLHEAIQSGHGPKNAADMVVGLAARLIDRMGPVVDELADGVDALEDELLTVESRSIRIRLRSMRRVAIGLRRYIAPQRDVMSRLQTEEHLWFGQEHRMRLREVADRITRLVEELDEVRERAAVIQDELMNRLSEQMNRTVYILTLISALMLPLGFITGLLGINVGGIPGAESPYGFAIVIGLLAAMVAAQMAIFHKLKWF